MSEERVLHPEEIADTPFPGQASESFFDLPEVSGRGAFSPEADKAHTFPRRRMAVELLSRALNTRTRRILAEFEFTPSGALQIGQFVAGVSGDLRLSPNGILGRNKSGVITFAVDGTTGDAIFRGELRAGSIVTGLITVGNNTWVIDGDPDQPRILLYDPNGLVSIVLGSA